MSSYRWIVQENMVDPYHGIVLSNKKERTMDTYNYIDESAGSMMSEKNNPQKLYTVWFQFYDFLKWQLLEIKERLVIVEARDMENGRLHRVLNL